MEARSMKDRIKLAKLQGWIQDPELVHIGVARGRPYWLSPDKQVTRSSPPDPSTDANDANALAVFLTQQGYEVHVMWPSGDRLDLNGRVQLYKHTRVADEYFDKEMFGDALSRAALKVLDDG